MSFCIQFRKILDTNLNVNQKLNNSQKMLASQCRMARAALKMTVRQLAAAAEVSHDTIVRLEDGQELKASTIDKVRNALESAGVVFTPENGDGPGVKLRKAK
jgi:DNA-binding XRE family transcriptional regulator